MLTQQPIKTDLQSWQICLGLLPLPEKVIQDIESGMPKPEPDTFFERVKLTKEQVSEIEAFAEKKIEEKLTAEEIYDLLIEKEMMPASIDGRHPSLAKISDIISNVRKRLGLSGFGRETGKIAYEMKMKGISEKEIAAALGLKENSVRSVASKYKKKLERGEIC